jgi:hypothetical protein
MQAPHVNPAEKGCVIGAAFGAVSVCTSVLCLDPCGHDSREQWTPEHSMVLLLLLLWLRSLFWLLLLLLLLPPYLL